MSGIRAKRYCCGHCYFIMRKKAKYEKIEKLKKLNNVKALTYLSLYKELKIPGEIAKIVCSYISYNLLY